MARFPLVTDPGTDEALRRLYDEIVEAGFAAGDGTPINWFTALGTRPDLVGASWELAKGVLLGGRLPDTLKQMIAMTVSIQNRCRYCTVVHTGALDRLGVPAEVVEACARDPGTANIPPPHRAVIFFALKAARDPTAIADADVEALRRNGLGDAEIIEVGMMAAFTNFINTWADVSGIPLDGQAAGG